MDLKYKFLIPLISILFLFWILITIFLIRNGSNELRTSLNEKAEHTIKLLALVNQWAVWNIDKNTLKRTCNSFLEDKELIEIKVNLSNGEEIIDLKKNDLGKNKITKIEFLYAPLSDEISENRIGEIKAVFTDYYITKKIIQIVISSIFISLIIFIIITVLIFTIFYIVLRPLKDLTENAEKISRDDFDITFKYKSMDEIGKLAQTFRDMAINLKNSFIKRKQLLEELQDANKLLEKEAEILKKAQEELNLTLLDLQRSNNDLEQFAYIASHDLKEPLRGISNYSAFLLEDYSDKLDPEGKNMLYTLIKLSNRMEKLIESLLYFSRVGRAELAFENTDLQLVINDILGSLDILIKEKKVEIRIPRQLPTIRCDMVRVGEIFRNLITNAIKYNESHNKWVEISYRDLTTAEKEKLQLKNKKEIITFYVKDNGIGIMEKHYGKLFNIFKRLHTRDKYNGGDGVGLAIVKKLVEKHKGIVWVESIFGEGSTFYFTLGD